MNIYYRIHLQIVRRSTLRWRDGVQKIAQRAGIASAVWLRRSPTDEVSFSVVASTHGCSVHVDDVVLRWHNSLYVLLLL